MTDTSTMVMSTSPHIRTKMTTPVVMWTVVVALIPAAVWAVYMFGISSLIVIGVSIAAAVLTEMIITMLLKKPLTLRDGSAFLTGLLVGFNMPAAVSGTFPLYVAIFASVFAIAVAKYAFGGLGQNWMNPALAGRIFVFFAWLSPMTSNWMPAAGKVIKTVSTASADAASYATPLKALKFGGSAIPTNLDLFLGKVGGCIGEVSAAALLLGGLILLIRKIINWEIPFFFIGSAALFGWIFGGLNIYGKEAAFFAGDPLFHILSGGVMLGAIFMATDWVTNPMTFKGRVLFAIGCGALTILIRLTGRNVEGVSFAIVLMNITVPLIDRVFKPRRFGFNKKRVKA